MNQQTNVHKMSLCRCVLLIVLIQLLVAQNVVLAGSNLNSVSVNRNDDSNRSAIERALLSSSGTGLVGMETEGSRARRDSITAADGVQQQPHHRVKRQYFKPSIDGSMLANERVNLLKRLQSESTTTSTSTVPTTTIMSFDLLDEKVDKKDVTVTSLSNSFLSWLEKAASAVRRLVN